MNKSEKPKRTKAETFIITSSGNHFYPFDPKVEDVNILDIAHALSMKCRWNGHIDHFFSVAQHSIMVYQYVRDNGGNKSEQRQALMHDAAEAYCVDMPSPIKNHMPDFIEMENGISNVIAERYSYPKGMCDIVYEADRACLYYEAVNLFKKIPSWVLELDETVLKYAKEFKFPFPMSSHHAKTQFMNEFVRSADQSGDIM